MNPEIKKLREELIATANYTVLNETIRESCRRAAMILQAVFDPENQPSQYGTTLVPR